MKCVLANIIKDSSNQSVHGKGTSAIHVFWVTVGRIKMWGGGVEGGQRKDSKSFCAGNARHFQANSLFSEIPI